MKNLSYVPGDAYAVVARDVTVVVGDLDHALLTRLWHTVSTTPDVMALLEVLGEGGFAAMPEFAATVRSGADLRVVTRGSGQVRVVVDGDPVTCDATGVSTWSEQRFPADRVEAMTATLGTPTDAAELPVVAGVVRASAVTTGDGAPGPAASSPPLSAPEEPEPAESHPVEEPPPAPDPVDAAQTMVEPEEASFDALFGATVAGRRPEDAAIREPEEAEEPAPVVAPPPPPPVAPTVDDATPAGPEGDHDQHTMTPEEFARLRSGNRAVDPVPAAPVERPVAPPAPPAGPRVVLSLSTGREIVMDRPVLVGRSPQARNTTSTQLPLLVVVDDPYVSGTHLELALVDGELRATDTSSNGTLLRRGEVGTPTPMTRSEAAPVPDGSVLTISEDVSITVSVEGPTP